VVEAVAAVVIPAEAEAEPRMPLVAAECPTPWAAAVAECIWAAEHPILAAARLISAVAGRLISAAAVRASAVAVDMPAAHHTSPAGRRYRILRHARMPEAVNRRPSTPAGRPDRP